MVEKKKAEEKAEQAAPAPELTEDEKNEAARAEAKRKAANLRNGIVE